MGPSILALNADTDGLKFGLFTASEDMRTKIRGEITEVGDTAHLMARGAYHDIVSEQKWTGGERPATPQMIETLLHICESAQGTSELVAAGYRIVHGGTDYLAPVLITPHVLEALETLSLLDPVQMSEHMAPLRAMLAARPSLPLVACFDTAFHHSMPRVAVLSGPPQELGNASLRRYGFHGLSYEYIAACLKQQSPELSGGRVVVTHLPCATPQTREEIDLLSYRISCEINTLTSALGGLDGLIFTASVSEQAGQIRAAICDRLSWLGLRLDDHANMDGHIRISTPDSRVMVRVIATNEEAMIARHTLDVLGLPRH